MSVNVTYRMGVPSDYNEIIDHANFVFSYAHCPHEFKTLIPKAYGENRTMWPNHFLALEDGRIRGLVGMLPFNQRVNGENIKVGFIGTVSVHHYSRGMGHMKKCMAMADAYARENGFDILALGGQRQRYEYYGYEPGGIARSFTVTYTNCRHALGKLDVSDITFKSFADVKQKLADIYAIYDSGIVAGARPMDSFELICTTWENIPRAILRGEEVIGYMVSSKDNKSVRELRLKDQSELYAVIKSYLNTFALDQAEFTAPPYMPEYTSSLARLAEGGSLDNNDMFMIVNYEHVIKVYLALKQRLEGTLPDGEVTLGISGIAGDKAVKSLTISVSGGNIDCHFTDKAPDAVYTTIEAQSLLLSPLTFVDVAKLPECARRYFPLPVFIENCDCF